MTRYRTIGARRKANKWSIRLKRGPGGNYLCRYCGTETKPPRRTFCSGKRTTYRRKKQEGRWIKLVQEQGFGCVHEYLVRSSTSYMRDAVFDRDQGICAECGTQHTRKGRWDADHIVPVVLGGGECGLENIQTLCRDTCHKVATAKLRKSLARKKNK